MKLVDFILRTESVFNLLSEEGKIDFLKTQFVDSGTMRKEIFDEIVGADPSKNNKYSTWLLNQYAKAVIKPFKKVQPDRPGRMGPEQLRAHKVFFEDLPGVGESLVIFDRHKNKFPKKDINQYTISELVQDALDVEDKLTDIEKSIAAGEHRYSADEKKYPEYKIGRVAGYTVWKIPQNRADLEPVACVLGQDTKWCTKDGHFLGYSKQDPLYIFIGKGTKYQFHYADNQFMNRGNTQMPEGELKDTFLKFIEDYEGRVSRGKDISGYKIGDYSTSEGDLPIYKIGKNKYYTTIQNQDIFYDPDTGLLKTKSGKTISDPGIIFTPPYTDFLKEIYRRLKEGGDTKGFRGIYRLLLGLDVPQKGPDEWWTINGDLNLSGSKLGKLPEGLHIKGDLDLKGSDIKQLPERIKVDGDVTGLD